MNYVQVIWEAFGRQGPLARKLREQARDFVHMTAGEARGMGGGYSLAEMFDEIVRSITDLEFTEKEAQEWLDEMLWTATDYTKKEDAIVQILHLMAWQIIMAELVKRRK